MTADLSEPDVGARIRELRRRSGLSLRGLAGRCGLSINAISRIERNLSSPTLSSLHQLATALGVSVTDFLEDQMQQAAVYVRPQSRQRFRGRGIVMDSLGSGLRGQELEPFMVTVEPLMGDPGDAVRHGGQEFVYCLSGEVDYGVGDKLYRLTPGDSLLFAAEHPHWFRNPAERPATLMLVFQADEGRGVARRRHLEV